MAYQSNLLGDFWRGYRQKRIGTGGSLSKSEMGGLLGPMLEYDARKAEEAGRREQQQNQFNATLAQQDKARKDQALASTIGGVGQLAMLPLAYGAGKNLGWWGKTTPTNLLDASVPPVTNATIDTAAGTNFVSPSLRMSPYSTLSAPKASAPSLLSPAAAGASTAQGSVAPVAGSTTAQGAAIGPTTAAEIAAYDAAMAEGAAAGVGSTAGTTGGLLSAAAPYAGPVGGGLLGGQIGSNLALKYSPIGGQREKKIGGGIAGGAAAGAAIGSVLPGPGTAIGAVIGGIVGGVSALF